MWVCAVRLDAGGFGRAERELNVCGGASARCQRFTPEVHAQRLYHTSTRRDRTLSALPYTGFVLVIFILFYFINTRNISTDSILS